MKKVKVRTKFLLFVLAISFIPLTPLFIVWGTNIHLIYLIMCLFFIIALIGIIASKNVSLIWAVLILDCILILLQSYLTYTAWALDKHPHPYLIAFLLSQLLLMVICLWQLLPLARNSPDRQHV